MAEPNEIPSDAGRAPWVSLLGCTCCILLGPAVLAFYTFSLFMSPLAAEIEAGRGTLSLPITVGTLATAVSSPIVGRWIDRHGGRAALIPGSIALALVMAILAFAAGHLASLFALFGVVGVLCSVFYIAVPRIVASLFDRRRGLALGIAMSGTGLGAMVLMPMVQYLIERWGWQAAYLGLAVLVLCISVPSALFLVSGRSDPQAVAEGRPGKSPPEVQSYRTTNFLLLAGAYFLIGVGLDGIIVHFVPIMLSQHLSAAAAASMFSAVGATIVAGRVTCGMLMDRVPAHQVGMTVFLISAIGVLLLRFGRTPPEYYFASALFGLGVGAEMDILGYLVSRLFPLEVFAKVYGLIYSSFMVGTSVGPPLFGILYDHEGHYFVVIWLAAAVVALAAIALGFIKAARARPAAWSGKMPLPEATS